MDIKKTNLNSLSDDLINAIKTKKHFFDTTYVVVPHRNVIDYFKAYWLKKETNILTNIKFMTFDEFFFDAILLDKEYRLADKEIINMFILKEIYNPDFKSIIKDDLLINNFIYKDGNINQLKALELSTELANLFIEYDNDLFIPKGWEYSLYLKVNEELNKFNYLTLKSLLNSDKTYKKYNENVNFFGFIYLSKLEESLLDDYSKNQDVNTFFLDTKITYDKPYNVFKAPSIEREIDLIHSEISELLTKKDISYNDFVVIGKNISEYANAINRSFSQDDKNFLDIPFSINSNTKKDSDTSLLIKTLLKISKNRYFTRKDLYEILTNPLVIENRNLSIDNIDSIMQMVIDLNIYRNGKEVDDWAYLKNRLILSKISGVGDRNLDVISLKDNDYLPYNNISLDDELVATFIEILDDINDFINFYNSEDNKYLTNKNILIFKDYLNKWCTKKDEYDNEINRELFKVNHTINDWIYFALTDLRISYDPLINILINNAKTKSKLKKGVYFNGVTFIDFNSEYILPAKYVFYVGMNTNSFPSANRKSELDQRVDIKDISKIEEDNFLLGYANAGEMTYISYLNSDSKNDDELFPSSFLNKLESKKKADIEKEIYIDETRDWSDLYTFKEYRNKEYYSSLLLESKSVKKDIPYIVNEEDESNTISINDLASLLKEPLCFKGNKLFRTRRDLLDDIKDEYEHFNIDTFASRDLFQLILLKLLKEKINIDDQTLISSIKKDVELDNKLTNINKVIEDSLFNEVLNKAKLKAELINKENNYEVILLPDLNLSNNNKNWTITSNENIIRCEFDDYHFKYYDINPIKDNANDSYYLKLYISALVDISTRSKELTYNIDLVSNDEKLKSFNITPNKAKAILIKLCLYINDYNNLKALPLDLYDLKKIPTLYSLGSKLIFNSQSSAWSYYKDKDLYNYETDFGYAADNYKDEIRNAYYKVLDLILYIDKIAEGGNENE